MAYKDDPRTIMFISGADDRVATSSPAGLIKAKRGVAKVIEELKTEGYRCVHDVPFSLGEAQIQVRVFEREAKPRLKN
jgi:hypothetical protein